MHGNSLFAVASAVVQESSCDMIKFGAGGKGRGREEKGFLKNVDPLGCFLLVCAEGRGSWEHVVAFEGIPWVTVANLLCVTEQPTQIKG